MKKDKLYKKEQSRYTYAYILAASLTIAVYALTIGGPFDGKIFVGVVLFFAGLQVYVQSRYFLHLDRQKKSTWKTISYAFTWLTLLIIAIGSVWIMNHLNYNMDMTPAQVESYMKEKSLEGY